MAKTLTFIIPVRHQANAKDWTRLRSNLQQTVGSIALQENGDWRAIIVANQGADLPPLPANFEVKWVDFPPNPFHERGSAEHEQFLDAVRLDKGRRILAGLLHAGPMQHVMIVDDDDFVSSKLTGFVAGHPQANGWHIEEGYVWQDGGAYLYRHAGFSAMCGSSHIIRADLFELPASMEAASTDYIKQMLGSHIFIDGYLRSRGTPLAALPFVGAVYRVGHAESHSKSAGLLAHYFLHAWLLKKPVELARRVARLKYLSTTVRREFFGA